MVEFEILSSHLHMARWHEAKIEQHTQDLDALQEASAKLKERLAALDQVLILVKEGLHISVFNSYQCLSLSPGGSPCNLLSLQALFLCPCQCSFGMDCGMNHQQWPASNVQGIPLCPGGCPISHRGASPTATPSRERRCLAQPGRE